MCIVYCVLCTVHCVLCIVYCVLCTVYSVEQATRDSSMLRRSDRGWVRNARPEHIPNILTNQRPEWRAPGINVRTKYSVPSRGSSPQSSPVLSSLSLLCPLLSSMPLLESSSLTWNIPSLSPLLPMPALACLRPNSQVVAMPSLLV